MLQNVCLESRLLSGHPFPRKESTMHLVGKIIVFIHRNVGFHWSNCSEFDTELCCTFLHSQTTFDKHSGLLHDS